MGLTELAKQIGIQLTADAIVSITNMIDKYKKNNKVKGDISDDLKKKAIEKHMGRRAKPHDVTESTSGLKSALATGKGKSISYKGGGKVKTYAKGSVVRKPRSY